MPGSVQEERDPPPLLLQEHQAAQVRPASEAEVWNVVRGFCFLILWRLHHLDQVADHVQIRFLLLPSLDPYLPVCEYVGTAGVWAVWVALAVGAAVQREIQEWVQMPTRLRRNG